MYPMTRPLKGDIGVYRDRWGLGFRVHVLNNWVFGFGVTVIIVLVLGKYLIIMYLEP